MIRFSCIATLFFIATLISACSSPTIYVTQTPGINLDMPYDEEPIERFMLGEAPPFPYEIVASFFTVKGHIFAPATVNGLVNAVVPVARQLKADAIVGINGRESTNSSGNGTPGRRVVSGLIVRKTSTGEAGAQNCPDYVLTLFGDDPGYQRMLEEKGYYVYVNKNADLRSLSALGPEGLQSLAMMFFESESPEMVSPDSIRALDPETSQSLVPGLLMTGEREYRRMLEEKGFYMHFDLWAGEMSMHCLGALDPDVLQELMGPGSDLIVYPARGTIQVEADSTYFEPSETATVLFSVSQGQVVWKGPSLPERNKPFKP